MKLTLSSFAHEMAQKPLMLSNYAIASSLAADEDVNYGMDIVENPATSNTQSIPYAPTIEQGEPSKFASTIITMDGPI
jgi:hypothetical protein